jgi:hemerythrin
LGERTVLAWLDERLVGFDQIGKEHEAFHALIENFQQAWRDEATKEDLWKLLGEIYLYTRFHFKREEHLMETLGYPGLDEHRKAHEQLITSLSSRMESFFTAAGKAVEIDSFLVKWFDAHTLGADEKFNEFCARQKFDKSREA